MRGGGCLPVSWLLLDMLRPNEKVDLGWVFG